jgi:hypothetical protein
MKLRSLGIFTIFMAGIFLITEGLSSAAVLEKKTIKRKVDPVIMDGKLARDVVGAPLNNLRLYAYQDGKFEPILFQIDEMTGQNGDWIMTGGPIKSVDLSNGKFDTWDKLLFMADDAGDKASKDEWISGYTKGSEIEIVDPLTNEKGWVYFLHFASNPPAKSSQAPYVTYDYNTEIFSSDIWGSEYIITEGGLHSTYYKRKWNTVKSGGNGESYVDRLKIRPTFKVFGVPIRLNEEGVKANVIGHQLGPIRLIRRLEQYVKVVNVPALRVVEDVTYCRYTSTVPVQFEVPLNHPKKFGINIVIRFGTDYAPSALGSMCYSSTNPQGFEVDGKMDDGEKNYNTALDNWRLITGDFGTFITRTMLTEETKQNVKITMGMIDDINFKHAPERYPGCIGYVWQDWDFSDAAKGKYHLYVEFYHMEKYKPGDEVRFLNYADHPIKIKSSGQEGISQLLLRPEYEKRYQKHYEPKDIQAHLKKNPM